MREGAFGPPAETPPHPPTHPPTQGLGLVGSREGCRGDSGLGRVGRISRQHTAALPTNFRVPRGSAGPLRGAEGSNYF